MGINEQKQVITDMIEIESKRKICTQNIVQDHLPPGGARARTRVDQATYISA